MGKKINLLNVNKLRIVFIIPNLGKGGAERVLANVIEDLDRRIFEISCVFYDSRHTYTIANDINIFTLSLMGSTNVIKKIYLSFARIIKIRNIINSQYPDVVVSFLPGVNLTAIAARMVSSHKHKLIISEHSIPSLHLFGITNNFLKLLLRLLYNKADAIIAVSKGVKNDLIMNFGIDRNKIIVINNPINKERIQILSKEKIIELKLFDSPIPVIITAGSLTEAKGQEYLLRAFKIVRTTINCKLLILGEGHKEYVLKKIATRLGIINDITFMGFQSNPYKFIAHSSVFVLSSLWEGFSNVLVEAMACNVPVISTDCKSGPREIISHMSDGILVPVKNEQKLAEAITLVLTNQTLARTLVSNAAQKIQAFSMTKIINEYTSLLINNANVN